MAGGLSVLVAEDEPLISMMLEDFLDMLGHRVAASVEDIAGGMAQVDCGCDIAILDVRLRGGEPVWPLADALADRGVPFLLATGGHVEQPPARHAAAPMLPKPYTLDAVRSALEQARRRGGPIRE